MTTGLAGWGPSPGSRTVQQAGAPSPVLLTLHIFSYCTIHTEMLSPVTLCGYQSMLMLPPVTRPLGSQSQLAHAAPSHVVLRVSSYKLPPVTWFSESAPTRCLLPPVTPQVTWFSETACTRCPQSRPESRGSQSQLPHAACCPQSRPGHVVLRVIPHSLSPVTP